MTRFGGLEIPDVLLDEEHARGILTTTSRDGNGHVYSGALFDTYPTDPGIRLDKPAWRHGRSYGQRPSCLEHARDPRHGIQALLIMQEHRERIRTLLARIPPDARIEDRDLVIKIS